MRTSCILIAVVLLLIIPVVVCAQVPMIRYELIADGDQR